MLWALLEVFEVKSKRCVTIRLDIFPESIVPAKRLEELHYTFGRHQGIWQVDYNESWL